jgi:hypothetical protein
LPKQKIPELKDMSFKGVVDFLCCWGIWKLKNKQCGLSVHRRKIRDAKPHARTG